MLGIVPSFTKKKSTQKRRVWLACSWLSLLLSFPYATLAPLANQKQGDTSTQEVSLKEIKNYKLKDLVAKGKKSSLSHEEIYEAISLSLYEKESRIIPLLRFFLAKKKRKLTVKECDHIMTTALEANLSYKVVQFLLDSKMYKKRRLLGTDPYSFHEFFSAMTSRLLGSIMMEPTWKKRIWAKVFRIEIVILGLLVTYIPFVKRIPYMSYLRQIFITLGTISTVVSLSLVVQNIFIIGYIKGRMYRPGYLFTVLQQKRYNGNSHRTFKLLVKYGGNPFEGAYFFYPQKDMDHLPNLLKIYRIEYIAPLHLAIKKNYIALTKWILQQNGKAIGTAAYIITDKKGSTITPIPETVTLQAIYSKKGDEKEQPCIKLLLPRKFCLQGTKMEELLIEYQDKAKSKK